MHYVLRVASDASRVLAELPPEVQEGVWDVFDLLAADPGPPTADPQRPAEVHEYRHVAQGRTTRVFFAIVVDDWSRSVLVPLLEYTVIW